MALFILITILTMLGVLYFLLLQTYVLIFETLVSYAILMLSLGQFVFACFAAIEFKALESAQ